MTPKFAHLAIGTEVTMGQILNSNSRWLSQQLGSIGFECLFHIAMPDDNSLIHDSFNFLKEKVDLIIISGGLGPTSDDLTRDLVAQFTSQPLVWSDHAWDHLVNYLNHRGVEIRDLHKKEALIPQGAQLLINPMGTACGFFTAKTSALPMIIALPGPPREIEAIWHKGLKDSLLKTFPERDYFVTSKWDVLGIPESAVADKVKRIEQSPLVTCAYRIHLPYVEFKIRYLKSNETHVQPLLETIEDLLKDHVFTKNGQDILEAFFTVIKPQVPNLFIFNPDQNLLLAQRLFEFKNLYSFTYQEAVLPKDPNSQPNNFINFNFDPNFEFLVLKFNLSQIATNEIKIHCEMSLSHSPERKIKMLIEKAFIYLFKSISPPAN